MMSGIEDIRQRTWDFTLAVITVILLASLGVQSFVGTVWVYVAQNTIQGWDQGPAYLSYISAMNAIAAPQILALVVVMGLCVPKRLFSRRMLLAVSLAMVVVGVIASIATSSLGRGLAIYLGLAAIIQVAVVVMTVAGVRGPSYLTEGRLTKTGSGLLHLGFILFGIVVVALQRSTLMLPVFSVSAVLVTAGTAMSFYANRIAWHRAGRPVATVVEVEPETAEEPGESADDDGETGF